jgi:tripartite-type tricarboxylate transporter receptor subunit TctC
MKKSKKLLLTIALGLAAIGGTVYLSDNEVQAYFAGGGQNKETRAQHREQMDEVFSNRDFQAFQEAIAGTSMAEVIDTQEEFNKLVEAHNLMEQARQIREELGLEDLREMRQRGRFRNN